MEQQKSHHRIVGLFLFVALNLLIAPSIFTARGQLKFKKCDPKPLPLQLAELDNQPQQIDSLCGNKGCFKSNPNNKQNEAKNNFCAPTANINGLAMLRTSPVHPVKSCVALGVAVRVALMPST